jgi:hypothetical protein
MSVAARRLDRIEARFKSRYRPTVCLWWDADKETEEEVTARGAANGLIRGKSQNVMLVRWRTQGGGEAAGG